MLKNTFISCLLITIVLAPASISSLAEDTAKGADIAILDMNNLLGRSIAVQSIREQINNIREDLSEELSNDEMHLKEQESMLLKKKGEDISKEEYDNLVSDFNKKVSEVQQKSQEKKSQIEGAHNDAMKKVYKVIKEIISQIANDNNYKIVLAKPNVLYHSDQQEITEEVLGVLNQRLQYVQVKFNK
jgi:Skp family chaperone for outer membrane proteins